MNAIIKRFGFIALTLLSSVPILGQTSKNRGNNSDSSSIEMEDVVVTGFQPTTQHQNAVKIDVLKLDGIEKRLTSNFAESLTDIPGVDMISKGSGVAKPVIRGMAMNDILVLNNGFRKENYQYSSHHPLGIDEFGVGKVEIIKGPASLLYGSDAIGGVMNFIPEDLPTQGKLHGDYQMQLFSNSLGMNNSLGLQGTFGAIAGSLRASRKSHADYLQGGGDYLGNSRFNEQSLKADLGYNPGFGKFRLQYEVGRENLGLVEQEALDEIGNRGRKPEFFFQQLNAQQVSSRNTIFAGRKRVELNGSFQQTELIHFGDPSVYELQMELSTLTGEAKLTLPIFETTQLIVGTQGMHQKNQNYNDRDIILLPNANIDNLSAFAFFDQTSSTLHVQGGLRYDYKTMKSASVGLSSNPAFRPALDKSYGSASGSLGLTWTPREDWFFRGNLATGYRTPNLAELTSNGQHEEIYEMGDATLSPERSLGLDLSVHAHKTYVVVDVAGFVNRVYDFIFQAPTGNDTPEGLPIYQYRQANSTLYGGEASVHVHLPSMPWLHLEQTAAWVVGVQDNGDALPFIPATKANTNLRATRKALGALSELFVEAQLQIAFDQNRPAPEESATPGYSLINLSTGCTWFAGKMPVDCRLGVDNLLDIRYIDHLSTLKEVGKYNPGRNLVLAFKLNFR